MKKLSTLIAAFLLTAGMAYAQNTASVSQEGSNTVADINQSGSNDAIITQVSAGLDVSSYITQVGFENTAFANITAPGGHKMRGASSDQLQEGTGNTASILAQEASMDMSAIQTQIGNGNQAFAVTRHDGIVEQEQIGNDNYAEANVVGKAMRTKQLQYGNDNRATMSAGNASVGSTYQEQVGNGNNSAINSYSSRGSARSHVNTFQEGDLNNVIVNFGPSGNTADVDQIGDRNNALVNFESGSKNEANVDQFGDDNLADILQSGDDNKASQWVAGNENVVNQSQFGSGNHQRTELTGSGNVYSTNQDGNGNSAYVNSRGTGPGLNGSFAYNSTFDATQGGNNNLISGSMGGSDNSLLIGQYGNNNQIAGGQGLWDAAGFTIEGNANSASIMQGSDGNSATLSMIGNGNMATISQDFGQVNPQ